jgi:hypothetical protein
VTAVPSADSCCPTIPFAISALTNFSDAQSGLASSTLVRTQSTVTAGVCDAFAPGSATTITGPAPIAKSGVGSGCYRYVLTGVNGFGGTTSLGTTVRFGP